MTQFRISGVQGVFARGICQSVPSSILEPFRSRMTSCVVLNKAPVSVGILMFDTSFSNSCSSPREWSADQQRWTMSQRCTWKSYHPSPGRFSNASDRRYPITCSTNRTKPDSEGTRAWYLIPTMFWICSETPMQHNSEPVPVGWDLLTDG